MHEPLHHISSCHSSEHGKQQTWLTVIAPTVLAELSNLGHAVSADKQIRRPWIAMHIEYGHDKANTIIRLIADLNQALRLKRALADNFRRSLFVQIDLDLVF